MNLRFLERAFNLRRYIEHHDPKAREYAPNIAMHCPHCDSDEKLWVLTEDKADGTRAGVWICYKCDQGGPGPLSLIRWLEDCTKMEAYEILIRGAREREAQTSIRELVMATLDGLDGVAHGWVEEPIPSLGLPPHFQLYRGAASPERVHHYLTRVRCLDERLAQAYGLGYCLQGYYRNRVIVPVVYEKQVATFVARYMRQKPPKGIKKTIYPKGSKISRLLYNYDLAKRCSQIVLVEDVFSAMAVGKHAVATFGTSLSPHQLELLLDTQAQELVVLWDNDAIAKAHKLAARLSEFWRVRVVELPDARDPDEYTREALRIMVQRARVYDPAVAFRRGILARLATV